jgi:hypothetical protein
MVSSADSGTGQWGPRTRVEYPLPRLEWDRSPTRVSITSNTYRVLFRAVDKCASILLLVCRGSAGQFRDLLARDQRGIYKIEQEERDVLVRS